MANKSLLPLLFRPAHMDAHSGVRRSVLRPTDDQYDDMLGASPTPPPPAGASADFSQASNSMYRRRRERRPLYFGAT